MNTFARSAPPLAAALLGLAGLAVPGLSAAAPVSATYDAVLTRGQLTDGFPSTRAANVRGTWEIGAGEVVRAELLDEHKFDRRGGLVGASYTAPVAPDWTATAGLAFGHGPTDWPSYRFDFEAARTWRGDVDVVTRAAVYIARFDAQRKDQGLRLSASAYLPGSLVFEAGITLNRSDPKAVPSHMPFASLTWGREGEQYLSLRVASGSEAYQAIAAAQLVDFHSRSAALTWRRWVGTDWGAIAQAEHYRNPSYERTTLGAGLFFEW